MLATVVPQLGCSSCILSNVVSETSSPPSDSGPGWGRAAHLSHLMPLYQCGQRHLFPYTSLAQHFALSSVQDFLQFSTQLSGNIVLFSVGCYTINAVSGSIVQNQGIFLPSLAWDSHSLTSKTGHIYISQRNPFAPCVRVICFISAMGVLQTQLGKVSWFQLW